MYIYIYITITYSYFIQYYTLYYILQVIAGNRGRHYDESGNLLSLSRNTTRTSSTRKSSSSSSRTSSSTRKRSSYLDTAGKALQLHNKQMYLAQKRADKEVLKRETYQAAKEVSICYTHNIYMYMLCNICVWFISCMMFFMNVYVCTLYACICLYALILVYFSIHKTIYSHIYMYTYICTLIQEIRRNGISQQTRSIRQLLGDDFWVEEKVGLLSITLYTIYTIYIHMLS